LMTSLQQQMEREVTPFITQWETALSLAPMPSLQEAQHQGTVQPQRMSMSYTL
jgi:hypothetical protein